VELVIAATVLLLAGAVVWAGGRATAEAAAERAEGQRGRQLAILNAFVPAIAAARADPRAILVWQPMARTARTLFPDEFAAIDRAMGAPFPFSPAQLQAAHAQWTAEWLAWERSHDAEYKRRAAEAERELERDGSPAARATLDAVEQEKLDLYQRHYEEYVRVAKALRGFAES
jgi:hypothetical protein